MRAMGLMLLVLLVLPAAATAEPAMVVEQCARQCDPKAVNGDSVRQGSEPVTQILYGHFANLLNRAPLNTQPPHPEHEPDLKRGFIMPVIDTNTGVCAPPGGQACIDFHFRNNEFAMFSSPGLVEYLNEGWRTHQEPRLNYEIPVVGNEIVLYWYMSVASSGEPDSPPVGVMPLVDVYARVETGRFAFRGDLIAEAAFNATSTDHRTTMVSLPDQEQVYEFRVRMKVVQNLIPADANGFIVSVMPYQIATSPERGAQLAQPNWQVRTGARFPVRVLLPTTEPLRTFGHDALIQDEALWLSWTYAAALGSYDRRWDLRALTVKGNATIDPDRLEDHTGPPGYHGHGFDPETAKWRIDLRNLTLPDGGYELEASVPNLQNTYVLRHSFPFEVKSGRVLLPGATAFEGEAVPFVSVPLLLLGLGALLVFRRR